MSDIEKRLRDTFDEIHAPENLKAKTLAAIEEARINQACTSEEECAVEMERADKKEHATITKNSNMASAAIANRAASTERTAGADHTSNTNHAANKKQGASAQSRQASVTHTKKRFCSLCDSDSAWNRWWCVCLQYAFSLCRYRHKSFNRTRSKLL